MGRVRQSRVPLDRRTADSDLFWALADRLDADHWATYVVTYGDMEHLDPPWHERDQAALRQELKQYEADTAEDFLREHRRTICANVQPDEPLLDRLRRRVAPLQHLSEPELQWSTAVWDPGWPFTDVGDFAGLPEVITNPQTSLGPLARLLLTVELGRLSGDAAVALGKAGVSVENRQIATRREWARTVFEIPRTDSDSRYPWHLSEFGLVWYLGHPTDRPVTLVVGDSAWDFALFYALRRWTSVAYWLPSALQRNGRSMSQLESALAFWSRRSQQPVTVVTASRSVERRDSVARDLSRVPGEQIHTRVAHWSEVLPDEPNRLFERQNRGRPRHVPATAGLSAPVDTPLPRRVRCRDESQMRWMTDVTIEGWTPLRNSHLGPYVIQDPSYDSRLARTTRTGAAYFCPHPLFIASAGLEAVTVRPRLRTPDLAEQIRHLVASDGWEVELSDKGVWAAEPARLFGGVSRLTQAIREGASRAAIDAYLGGTAGVKLNDRRRYLTVRDFREKVFAGDAGLADETLTALFDSAVLLRGILLKCGRCRQESWYDIADVSAQFRCHRCRFEQETESRWRGGIEPLWYYGLAEVVFQFLNDNGHLPTLAVEDRLAGSRRPTDRTSELKFIHRGRGIEAELDIACSDGYRLVLGEASTTGRFTPRSRLTTLGHIAANLDPYELLFATSRRTFPPATRDQVETEFKDHWPRVAFTPGTAIRP
jgi:hypothetical protein